MPRIERVEIGGEVQVHWSRRSAFVNEARFRISREDSVSESFLDAEFTLRALAEFSERVALRVTLRNNGRLDRLGDTPDFMSAWVLDVEEAYVSLTDVWQGVDLHAGLQDVEYDFLHDGDAMMFDVNEAIDPHAFGGFRLRYDTDTLFADFVYGMTVEERIEGVAVDPADASLGLIHVETWSDSGNAAAFAECSMIALEPNDRLWTVGCGFDYWPVPDFELYGIAYWQTGRMPAEAGGSLRHRSEAWRAGLRFTRNASPSKPYVDVSLWHFGGDGNPDDTVSRDFFSYGDVDTTMIWEEDRFGAALRGNYEAVKIKAGMEIDRETRLDLVAAWLNRESTPYDDSLGRELDVHLTRQWTQNLTVRLGFGWVWNADAAVQEWNGHDSGGLFQVLLWLRF